MSDSWSNDGKGGITITPENKSRVRVNSYSGKRVVKKGEQLRNDFNILITPFYPLETKKHWHNRYYHKYSGREGGDSYFGIVTSAPLSLLFEQT